MKRGTEKGGVDAVNVVAFELLLEPMDSERFAPALPNILYIDKSRFSPYTAWICEGG